MSERSQSIGQHLFRYPGTPIQAVSQNIYHLIPTNYVPVHQQVAIFRRSGIPGSILELLPGQFVFVPVQPFEEVQFSERISERHLQDRHIEEVSGYNGEALMSGAEEREEHLNPLSETRVWQSAYSLVLTTSRQIMHHVRRESPLNSRNTVRFEEVLPDDIETTYRTSAEDIRESSMIYSRPHTLYLSEYLTETVTNLLPENLGEIVNLLAINRRVKRELSAQESNKQRKNETSTEQSTYNKDEVDIDLPNHFHNQVSLNGALCRETGTITNVLTPQRPEQEQDRLGPFGIDSSSTMTELDMRALRNRLQYDWSMNINLQTDHDAVAAEMIENILQEINRNMTNRDLREGVNNHSRPRSFTWYFNSLYYQFFYETYLWMYFAVLAQPRRISTWALLQIIAEITGQPSEDVTVTMLAGFLEGSISQIRESMENLDSVLEGVDRDQDISDQVQTAMRDYAMLMNIHLDPRRMLQGFSEVIKQAARALLIDTGATIPTFTQR